MSDFNEIIKAETPVLLDFYADWCGPCQTMHPIVDEIKHLYGDKLRVLKINVDKNQQVSQRFKIQSIPTFLLFKSGEIEWRSAGIQSRNDLKKVIDKLV